MSDKRNVDDILQEWADEAVNEAMHPMQAIQTIQTACRSMEDLLRSARMWYGAYADGYNKKGGSMAGVYSNEQMLDELVKVSESMMRQAKKINSQAVKAVKAHKALEG